MLPLFSPPPSSEDEGDSRRGLVAAGLGMAVALGMVMLFVSSKDDISPMPFFFILGLLPVIIANNHRRRTRHLASRRTKHLASHRNRTRYLANPRRRTRYQAAAPAKRKREFAGEDIYTLMDRMVDELDEDEAAYLRRRLDEREHRQEREDTKASIADLLDDREQNRREQS